MLIFFTLSQPAGLQKSVDITEPSSLRAHEDSVSVADICWMREWESVDSMHYVLVQIVDISPVSHRCVHESSAICRHQSCRTLIDLSLTSQTELSNVHLQKVHVRLDEITVLLHVEHRVGL